MVGGNKHKGGLDGADGLPKNRRVVNKKTEVVGNFGKNKKRREEKKDSNTCCREETLNRSRKKSKSGRRISEGLTAWGGGDSPPKKKKKRKKKRTEGAERSAENRTAKKAPAHGHGMKRQGDGGGERETRRKSRRSTPQVEAENGGEEGQKLFARLCVRHHWPDSTPGQKVLGHLPGGLIGPLPT